MNKQTKEFIDKGKNKHKDENGIPLFDYPETLLIETPSQSTKIEIFCKKHNINCTIEPRLHLQNETGGCGKCRADKTSSSKMKKSKEKWENDILNTHLFPDGTQKYDYSEFIFTKRDEPSIIICKTCKNNGKEFRFYQAPNHHIDRKQKCNNCASIESGEKQTLPIEEIIKKCKEKHGDKYDYNKIQENYKNTLSMIAIYCKECDEYFVQKTEFHLRGSGCKNCGIVKSAMSKLSDTDAFVEKAKKINKNNLLCDYSNTIYKLAREYVNIKCIPCSRDYKITPNNHLRGKGCPTCNHHTSRPAIEWLNYIQLDNNIILQTAFSDEGEFIIPKTNNFKADGYDKNTKTIYEFHGNFWHGNPKIYSSDKINEITKSTMGELYKKTQDKKKICEALGYKYVEIWESDWNELKNKKC
jgi:hypothetical protein